MFRVGLRGVVQPAMAAVLLAVACAAPPESQNNEPPQASPATRAQSALPQSPATSVFVCPGNEIFVLHTESGNGTLYLPASVVALREEGRSWRGEGWEVRISGERAVIRGDGSTHRDCVNDRLESVWQDARIRGVTFRAAGNEPGWYLELGGDGQAVLVTAYGAERQVFEKVRSEGDPLRRLRAEKDGKRLTVRIEQEPCVDATSGESYPMTVAADLDGEIHGGCGMELTPPEIAGSS